MVKKAITALSPSMQKRVGVLWSLTKSNSLLTESPIGVKIYVSSTFLEIHAFPSLSPVRCNGPGIFSLRISRPFPRRSDPPWRTALPNVPVPQP